MSATPLLDHMVINVRFEMDRAQALFEALGFEVTPRGYHSLGSINHLMICTTDYLELLGLPAGEPPRRADIAKSDAGINGLVFKTPDVDATYAHLCKLGMDGDPPRSFSRPVEIDGGSADASFSTVTVRSDVFAAGRVYFCQHHTPELVWRAQWQNHPNGVHATKEFVIVAQDAKLEAHRYAELLQRELQPTNDGYSLDLDGSMLSILSEAGYQARYGANALALNGKASMFGALGFRTKDIAAVAAAAGANPAFQVAARADRVVVTVPEFASVVEFTA